MRWILVMVIDELENHHNNINSNFWKIIFNSWLKQKNAVYATSTKYIIQCRFICLNISNLEYNSIQIHRWIKYNNINIAWK